MQVPNKLHADNACFKPITYPERQRGTHYLHYRQRACTHTGVLSGTSYATSSASDTFRRFRRFPYRRLAAWRFALQVRYGPPRPSGYEQYGT